MAKPDNTIYNLFISKTKKMKKLFVTTSLCILSALTFGQSLASESALPLASEAYVMSTVTKDTSWVSERRTSRSGGVHRSGIFNTLPGYRIVNVDFRCVDAPSPTGGACPWNYNPAGGYGKNISIDNCGKTARWSRYYDGASCTQNYTITYKKVEIGGFWKDKLKFITDGDYNADSKVYLKNSSSLPVTVRYKSEYSIGGIVHISECNIILIPGFSNQFVGPKYIRNADGNFIINYEVVEAPM